MHDFDMTCMLNRPDMLMCDASDWYHAPNWIELHATD
jgi:hypothetical protein